MSTDHFAHKAGSYDQNQDRVDNVQQIAEAMLQAVRFAPAMQLMDFGSGTGLLLERIAPYVGKISAVDVSPSMQDELRGKLGDVPCEVELIQLDLETSALDRTFDGIISSMTMHHIQDIAGMFAKFHAMLCAGGFIAIADLDREDGSFHSEDTGVRHEGFERDTITRIAVEAGFRDVTVSTASVMRKHGRDYSVFLLIAHKA
jgi:cyclopropane fatty-acyl-phospholipid synthase-like methyltransferase